MARIKFSFKRPEDSPGYLLAQLTLLWQRKQKKVLDPLDLTHTQFVLLSSIAWLTQTKDNVTQVSIAKHNNFDRMMVSKVVRTLEAKNWIARQEHDTDTRAKVVRLTSDGEEVLQKALINVENADFEFFSGLDNKLSELNTVMLHLIRTNRDE